MTADTIVLGGIRALGVCGVLAEERHRPQPFEVDVELSVDLTRAGESDDLADTVDYGRLVERVAQIVETAGCRLLETLAARIADDARADTRVERVVVTVRKLRPPVPVHIDHVAVRIER